MESSHSIGYFQISSSNDESIDLMSSEICQADRNVYINMMDEFNSDINKSTITNSHNNENDKNHDNENENGREEKDDDQYLYYKCYYTCITSGAKVFAQFRKSIGSGAFGRVFKGLLYYPRKSRYEYANQEPKKVNEDDHDLIVYRIAIKISRNMSLVNEAETMKMFRGIDNLVQIYGFVQTQPSFIVMELMQDGSLGEFLMKNSNSRSLSYESLISISSQVANGMKFLETNKMIHMDLAARNILVRVCNPSCLNQTGERLLKIICKISDFGSTLRSENKTTIDTFISIRWAAPERFNNIFSIKSDVWSFGIVLYEIVTRGLRPYDEMEDMQVVYQLYYNQYRLPRPEGCDLNFYNLMLLCWKQEPNDRPTFEQLYNCLTNQFSILNPV